MYRQILVGMVGLVLAGCAQTRPVMPAPRTGSRLPPVGLTPVPNIYEAINRENPRFDPASLHPESGPVLANLGAGSRPGPVTVPIAGGGSGGTSPGAGAACGCSGPSGSPVAVAAQPRDNPPATGPSAAAVAPPTATGVGVGMAPTSPAPGLAPDASASMRAPAPRSLPDPSIGARPDAVPAMEPATMPGAPEIRQTSASPGVADPASQPGPPLAPDPSIAAEPDAVPLPVPAPAPASDLPAPAEVKEPVGSHPASASGQVAPSMPPEPPPAVNVPPGDPAATAPDDLPPLPSLEALDPPGPGPGPAPTTSLPAAAPAPASASAPTPGAEARSGPVPTADPDVARVAGDLTSLHDEETPVKLKEAGRIAARVGDEVITHRELTEAVKEKIAGLPQGYKPNRQEIMMITSNVLDSIIERSIIIQEAKREMKKPEMIARFMGIAEKVWREEELPPLLRKMSVLNEYELKEKFKEQGKSLDEMREMWKQDFLAKGFLEQKLRPKISVEYSEMRAYYNAHLDEFNRPAAWTWREVLVEMDKHPSRAEARKKAEAILARLRHGDDFAQVAQAESEGPNRSSGGLWETAPESYAVAAVNDALKTLPLGQTSAIIEGPSSYHIVRVETRRAAGPATFAEVQDKVRRILHRQKVDRASGDYLDKLRRQTVVATIFDDSDYPPAATRNFKSPNSQ